MLKFIGSGSAFNTSLGNNGAYIKKDDKLFMIDCGSSTFERIQRSELLKDINDIYVLITHNHPDHVGSLGDLIFYSYYSIQPMFKKKLHVLSPYNLSTFLVLENMGVTEDLYTVGEFDSFVNIHDDQLHIYIEPVEVNHVKELNCYGYLITYENKKIYYSGDCNDIPDEVLNLLYEDKIDCFYQDTCKADYPGNVHMSLRLLQEKIPIEYRNKVYCMHLDNSFDVREAKELGFNVVENAI